MAFSEMHRYGSTDFVGHESSGYKHQDYDITDYLLYGDGQNQTNLVW